MTYAVGLPQSLLIVLQTSIMAKGNPGSHIPLFSGLLSVPESDGDLPFLFFHEVDASER